MQRTTFKRCSWALGQVSLSVVWVTRAHSGVVKTNTLWKMTSEWRISLPSPLCIHQEQAATKGLGSGRSPPEHVFASEGPCNRMSDKPACSMGFSTAFSKTLPSCLFRVLKGKRNKALAAWCAGKVNARPGRPSSHFLSFHSGQTWMFWTLLLSQQHVLCRPTKRTLGLSLRECLLSLAPTTSDPA